MMLNILDDRNQECEINTASSVALVDFPMPTQNLNMFCSPFHHRM